MVDEPNQFLTRRPDLRPRHFSDRELAALIPLYLSLITYHPVCNRKEDRSGSQGFSGKEDGRSKGTTKLGLGASHGSSREIVAGLTLYVRAMSASVS